MFALSVHNTGSRCLMTARSFLPFAARFFRRHPTKLSLLRQHWIDYTGRVERIGLLTGQQTDLIESFFYELECEPPPFLLHNGWAIDPIHPAIYYALVRLIQPEHIVETGVFEGNSTRFILLALRRNERGMLHSIDLPNTDFDLGPQKGRQAHCLPQDREAGWLVPESLRNRWQLHLGNTKDLLPKVMQELGTVEIFIHDSLHSYEHMMFEYMTAWPHIRKGGILLSDDTDWNSAFPTFATEVNCSRVMFNYRLGAIRKS